MVKIVRQAGQKCTLNKPLYCPKNGEHLIMQQIMNNNFLKMGEESYRIVDEAINSEAEEIGFYRGN
jgi:hypothetical protein